MKKPLADEVLFGKLKGGGHVRMRGVIPRALRVLFVLASEADMETVLSEDRIARRLGITGVPCLTTWPAGPSSRIGWPSSFRRRNAMNLGPITTEKTIAIRPAMKTLTIYPRPFARAGAMPSRATARDAFTSTASPGWTSSRAAASAASASGTHASQP